MTGIALLFRKGFLRSVCCDIEFATYDRFDLNISIFVLVFICFSYEFKSSEHIPVITDGKGGHSIRYGFLIQFLYRGCAIQQGELSMNMEMREFHGLLTIHLF